MAKALPVMGIVGSVTASLTASIFVPDSLPGFLPVFVAWTGAGFLFAQRSWQGVVAASTVLVISFVAALGLVGFVSTENGGLELGVSGEVGRTLAILACLAIPGAALWLRWDDAEPRWLAYASAASAVVAVLLVAVNADSIADQSNVAILAAAVLALASLAGMVPLLRAEPPAVPRQPPSPPPPPARPPGPPIRRP